MTEQKLFAANEEDTVVCYLFIKIYLVSIDREIVISVVGTTQPLATLCISQTDEHIDNLNERTNSNFYTNYEMNGIYVCKNEIAGEYKLYNLFKKRMYKNKDIMTNTRKFLFGQIDSNSNTLPSTYTMNTIMARSIPFTFSNHISSTETTPLLVDGIVKATKFKGYSDEKLKTNVENIKNGLDIIKKIQGKSFYFIDDESIEDKKKSYGVIAQDIQTVIPDIVDTDDEYMTVSYTELIPFLIESVKELEKNQNYKLCCVSSISGLCIACLYYITTRKP